MRNQHLRHSQKHMATTFDLTISATHERRGQALETLRVAHEKIARLENELSEFLDTSPVYQLNQAEVDAPIAAPDSLLQLLERSDWIEKRTGHYFDVTAKSSHSVSRPAFAWDAQQKVVWKRDSKAHLSFGAIGKGFAIDQVREIIEREGFHDYCLSAGGSSIFLSGFSAPETPWQWGWSWKKDSDNSPLGLTLTHFSGRPVAIGVSGLHEKGFHITDSNKQRPAGLNGEKTPHSVLLGSSNATDADAFSTAFFVGGWDKAVQWLSQHAELWAIAEIDCNEVPRWNGIFQSWWGPLS